jgi:predicted DNA-binding transcriptional regulator AlpA
LVRLPATNETTEVRPERFLRRKEVARRVGVTPLTIWSWVRRGEFPQSYRLNPNSGPAAPVAWKESEIVQWINSRPIGSSNGYPQSWAARKHNAMLRRTSGPTPVFGFRRMAP